jgi:hypothetical protein
MSIYLQSNFEKAVVRIILHLFELDKSTRGFNLKKELFDKLRINSSNWNKITTSIRGIPPELHQHIRKVLVNEFDVNPGFLDTNSGTMFLTGKFEVHEPGSTYSKVTVTDELSRLRLENAELRELVATQKKLIVKLEGELHKPGKKSSK